MPSQGYGVNGHDVIAGSDHVEILRIPEGVNRRRIECEIIGKHKILRATQSKLYGIPFTFFRIRCDVRRIEIRDSDRARVVLVPSSPVPNPIWESVVHGGSADQGPDHYSDVES